MKKLIALFLCLCLTAGIVPVFAEDNNSASIVITRDEIFETARAFVRAGEDVKGFALFEFLADRGVPSRRIISAGCMTKAGASKSPWKKQTSITGWQPIRDWLRLSITWP